MNSAGLCAPWPSIESVSAWELNSPWHLGPLPSVPLSPVFVWRRWEGGGNVGKHKGTVVLAVQKRGEVLGLLAPGGILGAESPGRIIAESHR